MKDAPALAARIDLNSRLKRVPVKRIRRRADYWALRRVEEEHVARLARQVHLSEVESEETLKWWMAEIDHLLGEMYERLFVLQPRYTRPPRIHPYALFQLWFNTFGPGGRTWFANRYVTIRRYTFRLTWRP